MDMSLSKLLEIEKDKEVRRSGMLQTMVSQRIGHNLATEQQRTHGGKGSSESMSSRKWVWKDRQSQISQGISGPGLEIQILFQVPQEAIAGFWNR